MHTHTILLVDDDPIFIGILRSFLEEKGIGVLIANSGKEAGVQLKKNTPDLIISDLNMPQMSGIEFIKTTKGNIQFNQIPIILLSTSRNQDDILEGLSSGIVEYMTKPVDLERLYGKVSGILTTKAKSILVADDDPIICSILKQSLSKVGYDVSVVNDGNDVFLTAKERKPKLILLDQMLPGKHGIAILKELKIDPETQSIPVVMVSSKTSEDEIMEALNGGAEDYISKPVKIDELLFKVRRLLQ